MSYSPEPPARSSREFHRRWRSDAIQGFKRRIDEIRPRPGDPTKDNQAFLVGNRADHINHRSRGRVRERLRRIGVARLLGRRRGQVQELTHGRHRFGAIGAGEQAIVTDAMETIGEDVDSNPRSPG
jgi:hypothetical protein